MKAIELLAPAGSYEKFKIAMQYGADAVYASASHFSLRERTAKDFSIEQLGSAIDYARSIDKKVYIPINGFPFTSQIKSLKRHLAQMRDLKPHAFIIAAPGVVKLAKEVAPDIPVHLSTQANVINYLDAAVYQDLGVTRIIAAREAGMRDLQEIKNFIPEMEIEIFVHGSMCFAFSGRCLLTGLQSGRVSNRGTCANDCRFPYEVYVQNPQTKVLMRIEETEEGSYIFNAKDLNMIKYIDQLVKSEVVDSFKIEGRTKSPYYVGITTRAYKQAMQDSFNNCFDSSKYEAELEGTKHRGFNDGFLFSKPKEKANVQKLDSAISSGDQQVQAMICEDGKHLLAKGQLFKDDENELVMPLDTKLDELDNEIAQIKKIQDKYFIKFKRLENESGKLFDAVHSGNTNKIKLPVPLPAYSFLRKALTNVQLKTSAV